MKKNILSVIGAATVAAVALKLTTKYVKNEVIKELEDDGYLCLMCLLPVRAIRKSMTCSAR